MTALLALDPREDDDPRGRDQQPETDAWPGWTGLRVGTDHTHHAGHQDREAVA